MTAFASLPDEVKDFALKFLAASAFENEELSRFTVATAVQETEDARRAALRDIEKLNTLGLGPDEERQDTLRLAAMHVAMAVTAYMYGEHLMGNAGDLGGGPFPMSKRDLEAFNATK